jgi:hypothetical protein
MRIFYKAEERKTDEAKEEDRMDVWKASARVVKVKVKWCDEYQRQEGCSPSVCLSDT